jgi:ribosomal protein S18 acetylase RimI-like enzyme
VQVVSIFRSLQIAIRKNMVTTRKAVLDDLDAVASLFDAYRQFYKEAPDIGIARNFIQARIVNHESVIFIAEDDAVPVGFTQLYPTFSSTAARRIWTLNDLFVAPAARGCGAGRALLEAARKFAIADGAARLELATAHNNPAQKLYEAAGYQRDNEFFHYILTLDK